MAQISSNKHLSRCLKMIKQLPECADAKVNQEKELVISTDSPQASAFLDTVVSDQIGGLEVTYQPAPERSSSAEKKSAYKRSHELADTYSESLSSLAGVKVGTSLQVVGKREFTKDELHFNERKDYYLRRDFHQKATHGLDVTVSRSSNYDALEEILEDNIDGVPVNVHIPVDAARKAIKRALNKEGIRVSTSNNETQVGDASFGRQGHTKGKLETFQIAPKKIPTGQFSHEYESPDLAPSLDILRELDGAELTESPWKDKDTHAATYKGVTFKVLPLHHYKEHSLGQYEPKT